jgi:hypothetical protein
VDALCPQKPNLKRQFVQKENGKRKPPELTGGFFLQCID